METQNATPTPPHQLIDWREFELFIAEIYKQGDDVVVQHDITEVGKSGARRQIDVLVYQKTTLHDLKIVIECKCWKKRVERSVIDTVFANVEDLNANKGVIFTTVGYEEGAINYAKNKNIDIFVVRDLTDAEWGLPGKVVEFYLQLYSGAIKDISFDNIKFFADNGLPPKQTHIQLQVSKNDLSDERFNLISLGESKIKLHLVKLIKEIHETVLNELSADINGIFLPANENLQVSFVTPFTLNFKNQEHRFLRHEHGLVTFDALRFNFYKTIDQSKFFFDRSSSSEFVLMVENYITDQKFYASKPLDQPNVLLSKLEATKTDNADIIQNGSIIKLHTDFSVDGTPKPGVKIIKCPARSIDLNVITPENKKGA